MSRSWQGWRALPGSAAPVSRGWVELSHVLSPEMPRIDFFPSPAFRRLKTMPDDPMNLSELHMVCHSGTHIDAPCHFVPDAPSIDQVPLDRLMGEGVLWRIDDLAEYDTIDVDRLDQAAPRARDGDVILLDTGWASRFPGESYGRHPSLTAEAAEWLVVRGAKLIGIDFATPDLSTHLRADGFDWPVHQVLLSHGVLIIEHLTGLTQLDPGRIELLCLALPIRGSDGAPARVLARNT